MQEILDDLRSPDEVARAEAVRRLCPCRTAWDVPVQRYIAAMQDDPSSSVRHEVHHVLDEDSSWGKKLEQRRLKAAADENVLDISDPESRSMGWYKKRKPMRKRWHYPQRRDLGRLIEKK
ncbi:MAG: hypothetical protein KY468_10830 [Armatimonadetes bacterium]|nr:hypothetical protein [Armatimonadota bacterium]